MDEGRKAYLLGATVAVVRAPRVKGALEYARPFTHLFIRIES